VTQLVYQDLRHVNSGEPKIFVNSSKPAEVPSVNGGVLWGDDVNKIFYQYGGEYNNITELEHFNLWQYDTLFDKWSTVPGTENMIKRTSWGAGVGVNELGKGFYLGGYLNEKNTPGWKGDELMMSQLVQYTYGSGVVSNFTGPSDGRGRAEGRMVFLPAGDGGLLVYFGGFQMKDGEKVAVCVPVMECIYGMFKLT
jgi:hypothetical protein